MKIYAIDYTTKRFVAYITASDDESINAFMDSMDLKYKTPFIGDAQEIAKAYSKKELIEVYANTCRHAHMPARKSFDSKGLVMQKVDKIPNLAVPNIELNDTAPGVEVPALTETKPETKPKKTKKAETLKAPRHTVKKPDLSGKARAVRGGNDIPISQLAYRAIRMGMSTEEILEFVYNNATKSTRCMPADISIYRSNLRRKGETVPKTIRNKEERENLGIELNEL